MVAADPLARPTAAEYASWFRALADPTRVQIVNLLARGAREMSVGEIADRLGVAQSTVSHHLRPLAEVGFVRARQAGATSLIEINSACISCFPSAADIVLGRAAPPPDPAQLPQRGRQP